MKTFVATVIITVKDKEEALTVLEAFYPIIELQAIKEVKRQCGK